MLEWQLFFSPNVERVIHAFLDSGRARHQMGCGTLEVTYSPLCIHSRTCSFRLSFDPCSSSCYCYQPSAPVARCSKYILTPLVSEAWHPRREMRIDSVDTMFQTCRREGCEFPTREGQSQAGDHRKHTLLQMLVFELTELPRAIIRHYQVQTLE